MRLDRTDNMLGDLILNREQVLEHAVVAVGPDVFAGLGLDQLAVMRMRRSATRTLPSST
jgi:hypothetical protein